MMALNVQAARGRPDLRGDTMLRLAVIVHNPLADSAVTWFGIVLVLLIASIVVLGLVLAMGRARRDGGDDASDPGLEAMKHRRLVVLRPRKSGNPQGAVVSELDPTGESEPAGR
jgi:hypothetical protein